MCGGRGSQVELQGRDDGAGPVRDGLVGQQPVPGGQESHLRGLVFHARHLRDG